MGHGAIYSWGAQLICGGQNPPSPIAAYRPQTVSYHRNTASWLISWNSTIWCLVVNYNGSIGMCGRLSQLIII